MNKYQYITLKDYMENTKNNVKQKQFSTLSCVIDPQNSYDSLDSQVATVLCADSGFPIGITRVNVKDNPPIDLLSTYSKEDTNIIPTNKPGEFAKYVIGIGNDSAQRGEKAWNDVSQIYCNSRKLSYDATTGVCNE